MTTEIERIPDPEIQTGEYVEMNDRQLIFREDTPYEVWQAVVRQLKRAEKNVHWWLGDAIRFGEWRYGEKYSQALEDTDYEYGSLANMAYVASKIEFSRRRENLSFSHHQEVAPLEPDEQDRLLDSASPEPGSKTPKKSSRDLRAEIQGRRERVIECARCGEVYPLSEAKIRTEPV